MNFRTGFGFDVHQLSEQRELWLGGIKIPAEKGALGHSDADVLLHAICDALLGAAALGDIGMHFPDTSADFKNIDSKILLAESFKKIAALGYKIGNIDSCLVLEKPKIRPHVDAMRNVIAEILYCETDQISIKATTNEKMGFIGRQEGVAAYASCLIYRE